MDIFPWFNSKDIADHLQELGRALDAAEMAYVIYQNETVTLERKLGAWHEIVETEPDCELRRYFNTEHWQSTHEFLHRLIEVQRKKLLVFNEPGGCLFYPKDLRRARGCGGTVGSWPWSGPDIAVFSSVGRCVEYLRQEYGPSESDEDHYDRFEIGRLRVDEPTAPEAWKDELVLNGNFEAMSVETEGLSKEEAAIDSLLSDWFLALPCPFSSGDIVIDATDPGASPFVFDRLTFWDSKDLAAHGVSFDRAKAEMLDARIARQHARGSWDCSYMVALGYELAAESQNPIQDHGCVYYDTFGACSNYLDLEWFDGPLGGERRLLGIVSEQLKGRLDIEAFLNFSQLISFEARAEKLRDDFDRDYDERVCGLYAGEVQERHQPSGGVGK